MALYASNSKKGFYDDSIHTPDQIPLDAVEITPEYHMALLDAQTAGQMISFDVPEGELPVAIDRPVVILSVEQYGALLNARIAEIYERYFRFGTEYTTREAAARAYRDAGYSGEVSVWISSFANAAGLENVVAADLIISQADALRVALEKLACLRMRKYELNDLEGQELLDKHEELMAAVELVNSGLK